MAIWFNHMFILAIWFYLAVLAIWRDCRRLVYLNYPPDNAPAFTFGNPARVAKRDKCVVDKTVRLLVANVRETAANVFHRRLPGVRLGHQVDKQSKRARWQLLVLCRVAPDNEIGVILVVYCANYHG